LTQSREIQEAIGLIDKLKAKISDKKWIEAVEENSKEFAEGDLVFEEDGD
jgi:hypothetical protein